MSIDKPYQSKNVLVDVESTTGYDTDLQIKNFGTSIGSPSPMFNANEMSTGMEDDLSKKTGSFSIWSLDYFKQFFDVDTDTVVNRIVASMYPRKGVNYVQNYISNKPDLYGPFWICVTLVFTIGISGNMANYLQSAARRQSYHWKYDFHTVSASASAIFLYAWIVPIIVWATLKYQKSATGGSIDSAEQVREWFIAYTLKCVGFEKFIWLDVFHFAAIDAAIRPESIGIDLRVWVFFIRLRPHFRAVVDTDKCNPMDSRWGRSIIIWIRSNDID